MQIAAKLCEIKYRPVLWRRRSHDGLFNDCFNSWNIYEDKLIGQKGCTLSYLDLGNRTHVPFYKQSLFHFSLLNSDTLKANTLVSFKFRFFCEFDQGTFPVCSPILRLNLPLIGGVFKSGESLLLLWTGLIWIHNRNFLEYVSVICANINA